MDDTRYEAPAVEDRTSVEVPLNIVPNSEPRITPVWRTDED